MSLPFLNGLSNLSSTTFPLFLLYYKRTYQTCRMALMPEHIFKFWVTKPSGFTNAIIIPPYGRRSNSSLWPSPSRIWWKDLQRRKNRNRMDITEGGDLLLLLSNIEPDIRVIAPQGAH